MNGKRKADMKQDEIAIITSVGESIVDALGSVPLEVEGTPRTSVKYDDGSFKMKPLSAGLNFFMAYSYLGARGDLVFGLTPEDAQKFEYAEFTTKTIDKCFPLAGGELAKAFNLVGENFYEVCSQLIVKRAQEETDAESRAKEAYRSNPMFGMF